MSKIIYTEEQVQGLRDNPNVGKCSCRSISYSKDFKLRAIKQYNEDGLAPNEIFRQAGFDLKLLGVDKPKASLKRWNDRFKLKGLIGLQIETRGGHNGGGRFKTKGLTEPEKIKKLEAEVAYLKAENDFLAKLRAKRAE